MLIPYSITGDFVSTTIVTDVLPNTEIANIIDSPNLVIWSLHRTDFTLQYLDIYSGSQNFGSISIALSESNPTSIPPEYCADASTELLATGNPTSVGAQCGSSNPSSPSGGQPSSSSSNYTSPLSSKQVVGVAVGAGVAVDAILTFLFALLLAFCP